jgi:hypothetical protein
MVLIFTLRRQNGFQRSHLSPLQLGFLDFPAFCQKQENKSLNSRRSRNSELYLFIPDTTFPGDPESSFGFKTASFWLANEKSQKPRKEVGKPTKTSGSSGESQNTPFIFWIRHELCAKQQNQVSPFRNYM